MTHARPAITNVHKKRHGVTTRRVVPEILSMEDLDCRALDDVYTSRSRPWETHNMMCPCVWRILTVVISDRNIGDPWTALIPVVSTIPSPSIDHGPLAIKLAPIY